MIFDYFKSEPIKKSVSLCLQKNILLNYEYIV